jgi:hypothetical protein
MPKFSEVAFVELAGAALCPGIAANNVYAAYVTLGAMCDIGAYALCLVAMYMEFRAFESTFVQSISHFR